MNPDPVIGASPLDSASVQASEISIPQLVGEVFDAAPPADKRRLLEQLLPPLGLLSLVAVANGIFAKIRFRSGWPEMHIRLEDVQNVRASEITSLVDHVQQVSVQAVDGLAQLVSASPVLASSGAAALLVTLLMRRAARAASYPAEVD
jgi:hypothetical protein